MSVVEFIVGYKPDHHPEGETLVCGVGETGRGMMRATAMTVTGRLRAVQRGGGGGEREGREGGRGRERERDKGTTYNVHVHGIIIITIILYHSPLLSHHNSCFNPQSNE